MTARETAASVRSGSVTALEVVEAALDAARRLDPLLHFVEELERQAASTVSEKSG
jgi:Asp-tRNA(Asn)/Glu-tRNA(Gln) amidotransferase A subunit family amidase